MKPAFITLEGGEGSGKTTQGRLLYQAFLNSGLNVIATREPGGTPEAEAIRQLLITGATDKWDKMTEILLHNAARNEHVSKLIKPALSNNQYVICDRFIDSSLAYQGYGHGLDINMITALHEMTIGKFYPDLTIIIDMPLNESQKRIQNRKSNNRYELMGAKFHSAVVEGYRTIARNNSERCVIINGADSIANIHRKIVTVINTRLATNLKVISNS